MLRIITPVPQEHSRSPLMAELTCRTIMLVLRPVLSCWA